MPYFQGALTDLDTHFMRDAEYSAIFAVTLEEMQYFSSSRGTFEWRHAVNTCDTESEWIQWNLWSI